MLFFAQVFTENSGGTVAGRIENLKPWRPGQSGNPGGRPKKRLVDDALLEELSRDDGCSAMMIARALIEEAKTGNLRAIQLIAERTQGKPLQKVAVSDDDSGSQVLTVEFVRAEPEV